MEFECDMRAAPPHVLLTPRERDVVNRVIAGRTNDEISRDLGIGEQAVKNVLSTVFQKCMVRNRLELVLFALHSHIVLR